MKTILLLLAFYTMMTLFGSAYAQETMYLWPGEVPAAIKPEADPVISDNSSGGVVRIAEVTNPLVKVYQPADDQSNGAAIIICPGGGYSILAINKEGYEIAEWFSNLGYTSFVLQYRVPQQQEAALMDLQRAIRLVRYHANQWDLDANRIGVLGFSAGGDLSARASTLYDQSSYPYVDSADSVSCRPDFTLLIYPAYLDTGKNNRVLKPEILVTASTPPMFLFVAADDKHANSTLVMAAAMIEANVPVEAHLYPFGGHGFGIRPGNKAAVTWPTLATHWLNQYVLANTR